ncbi:FkbM family methyltransferase [Bradyrhizobium sp. CB1015]|uniref:FkbM family methyltransferase n=1 Tax=Bradyrhizobium sp. CB1015 TaxID=2976822 RepID=UPI0021A9A394|nr:FkbM family methyltransferase [Bradyrhizobium sp. CB1015]UWU89977.1 FkbM family methyltransferase [Bradyrhizobium sp. CB1015]
MGLLAGLRAYYTEFGFGGVSSIARFGLTGHPKRVRVQINGIKQPFTIRMRSSDHRVFHDIFQQHEYLFNPPEPPSTIIDAGANIGFASIYFANRWPNARIVAIEPDPANFELLVENTRPYPNIQPLQAAVWKENAKLDMFDPGTGSWGMQTMATADGGIDGLTLPEIMRRYDMPRVDVLKMDIEGAEREVFENCAGWIDRIGSLVIEIHEHLRPGAEASVMQAKGHFKEIYHKTARAGTWYMLRERGLQPDLPQVCRGRILS